MLQIKISGGLFQMEKRKKVKNSSQPDSVFSSQLDSEDQQHHLLPESEGKVYQSALGLRRLPQAHSVG